MGALFAPAVLRANLQRVKVDELEGEEDCLSRARAARWSMSRLRLHNNEPITHFTWLCDSPVFTYKEAPSSSSSNDVNVSQLSFCRCRLEQQFDWLARAYFQSACESSVSYVGALL